MDEQQPSPQDGLWVDLSPQFSGEHEAAIDRNHLERLRAELIKDDDLHLSSRAIALLNELCVDARRRGVKPERLIVALKDEIRSATTADEYRRRPLLDEAVTRCIRLFFASEGSS